MLALKSYLLLLVALPGLPRSWKGERVEKIEVQALCIFTSETVFFWEQSCGSCSSVPACGCMIALGINPFFVL